MHETLGDDPPIDTPRTFTPDVLPVPTDASDTSATMLEPHAPHEPIHSWKSFAIHIAAIAVGLLLALALEQSAEAIHHGRQRSDIEAQMHAVLQADTRLDDEDFKQLRSMRAYLIELRAANATRLHGAQAALQPSTRDSRMAAFLVFPSLAPYEAAQRDGTVALLPADHIRLYNRLAFARDVMAIDRDSWFKGIAALEAFQQMQVFARDHMGSASQVGRAALGASYDVRRSRARPTWSGCRPTRCA